MTPWGYQIYLLQLENYELRRFWRILAKRGFWPGLKFEPRHQIAWSSKLRAVALGAGCLAGLTYFFIEREAIYYPWVYSLILWLIWFWILTPLWLSLAVIVISPLDTYLKENIIAQAKSKIGLHRTLKIIGIAGSYGKTTVKEFIAAVLKEKFNVLVTPENINTPLGIARLIIKSLSPQTEILVVEMGEYYRGDVAEICALTPPDIAVITGLNEAHLERLKNLDNTAATIFEIVDNAKPNATLLLNADDKNIKTRFRPPLKNNPVQWFSWENNARGEFPTQLLGRYALGSADAAIQIGRKLGVDDGAIKHGVMDVAPIAHRLQPIIGAGDVLVIDDSYNGNPAGVGEAILALAKYTDRRKIFLTPGLVETGGSAAELHQTIGIELAPVADLIILIKNSVTPFIAHGLDSAGFAKDRILWFNTALEAHQALKNILKPRDVILFQNDWTDNYV